MGQDIHTKEFVYSKVENRLVNCCDIYDRDSLYSSFPVMYEGRYYNLFSLFGSSRSDYPQLSRMNTGIPDGIPETFRKYLDLYADDYGYHTFSWFYLGEFKSALHEYIECLKQPAKFFLLKYSEDDNADESIKNHLLDIEEWNNETTPLMKTLEEISKKVEGIYDDCMERNLDRIVDLDKSVLMFWFDN